MTRPRFGLVILCVAALSGMVLGTAGAHATVGAKWLLGEYVPLLGTVKLIPFLPVTLEFEQETTIVVHTKVSGVSVLFECKGIQLVNAKLLANGSIGEGEGAVKNSKIKFSECITKLNGATSAPCEPTAGGTEKGVVRTNPLHALLVLNELAGGVKDDIIQVLPDSGETFLKFEMSEECSIGEVIPLIGKLTLKDCQNLFLAHLQKHLFEVGPSTELWTISKTAEHVTTVLTSWWAEIIGAHKGLYFSGDPI